MIKSSFDIYNAIRRSAISRSDYKEELTPRMKANVRARIDSEVARIDRLAGLNLIGADDAETQYKTAYQMYNLLERN